MPEGGDQLQPVSEAEVTDTGTEGGESDNGDTEPTDETARETVERVLREAETEDAGEESEPAESKPEVEPGEKLVRKRAKQTKGEAKQAGFTIPAPNRLTAEQKEAFHAMPDDLKRAVHGMFRAHEGEFTRAMQAANARERESAHIQEAVRPYLLAHPELQEQGFTESRLVSALIAAHQRLTDPKTARQAWVELGQQIGVDPNLLQAAMSEQPHQVDIGAHPEIQALRRELEETRSYQKQFQQQQFESAVESVASEMEAVRNEMDGAGRFLYPKLHDPSFLEQVKPLVSDLVRALPTLGYGEALRRAYMVIEGQPGNSYQANQARFPAQNEQVARAQQAAVSVRGRIAPNAPAQTGEIPAEALGSTRDTVRWALNELRRGA